MTARASRVLVLFAHPAMHKSRANRRLIADVRALPDLTFHDLYEAYPDQHIDVEAEQALLVEHDVIVLHFPFFWYSTPAILKEWQDLVLVHGWAYGRAGTALRGKALLVAMTTGGSEQAYHPEGYNRFTIRELLAPLEATARICGMRFLAPFVVHGTHLLDEEALARHAAEYLRLLVALREGHVDLDAAERATSLNADLDSVLVRKEV